MTASNPEPPAAHPDTVLIKKLFPDEVAAAVREAGKLLPALSGMSTATEPGILFVARRDD